MLATHSDERPNILLLMTDQHRADCLGLAGHPVLQTPFLDQLGSQGLYFPHAYSACPQCVPARRTLMTGRSPHGHGVFCNYHTRLEGPTLAGELTQAGYHTHLCGKLHLHPHRALHGFMSADWADSHNAQHDNDYTRFIRRMGQNPQDFCAAPIGNTNTWIARPWPYDERLHVTNWTTQCALDFLERRDPTCPFFLKVSYFYPHQPCLPPQVFWDRYINAELPPLIEADWSHKLDERPRDLPVDSWQTRLSDAELQQFRAGYLATINHLDEQIGRILNRVPRNTVVLFVADHGEMLGDHQWVRKTRALEGSARVPFLLNLPAELNLPRHQVRDEAVELMDVMPTLLDLAGAPIPASVEGQSLIPRLRDGSPWRARVHGEQSAMGGENSGMQYLTDGHRKYIWEPGLGRELFFDLDTDPHETANLANEAAWADVIAEWRADLIQRLEGRPEGFVVEGQLVKLPGYTRPCRPEFARN